MAVRSLSRVALGPDAVGYKFKIVPGPEDQEIYEAGLELERSLSGSASGEASDEETPAESSPPER